MIDLPEGYHFTKEHEWISVEDSIATIGITDFAQQSLGDLTYVQLPKEGSVIKKDDPFGVVESVKAVSDLYAPISGTVIDVNQPLLEAPELINEDPYEEGWMIKVEIKDTSELDDLMNKKEYQEYLEENE